MTEFTKVTVREAQTTMEMQLNPEHLGKLYIEVTTKEGNVSAHIMTQNELVKEALESQMAELKQSMNQAGVKVDAVEVTVGSHEFEKNLDEMWAIYSRGCTQQIIEYNKGVEQIKSAGFKVYRNSAGKHKIVIPK